MPVTTKKATFSLHEEVLDALNDAVKSGAAPSKNAFVERALLKELRALRKHARRTRWEEAAKDPLLLEDLDDVEEAFRSSDAESARRIV